MNRFLSTVAAAAVLTTGLGACSRSAPEQAPSGDTNMSMVDDAAPPPAETPDDAPPPIDPGAPASNLDTAPADAASNAAADEPLDRPAVAPIDQQVMDDASATGMTSRSRRGDRGADNAAPGQVERK